MKLKTELLTTPDLPLFVDAMFETFYNTPDTLDYAIALWGHDSPAARKLAADRLAHELTTEKNQLLHVVRDMDAGGKIISGTEWHVNLNSVESIYAPWGMECEWLEGQERADAKVLLEVLPGNMNATMKRYGEGRGEAHLRLMLMWTLPEYHGKGAGSLGMKWGVELADHLGLPAWVEASRLGRKLYVKSGFDVIGEKDVTVGKFSCFQTIMRRPAREIPV